MEYGEKLYVKSWIRNRIVYSYRFRIDPIPFTRCGGKGYFRIWYKIQKTTNEKRQYYGNEEFVRLKRNPRNLPNPWDDYPRADRGTRRSWKKRFKCRKQWGKNK